ncbi:molybdate ABC transporter substrate-binding protein [Prosthecomicrobium sp. N25]|uniref:molybdate ABC transporter substrate-binding protein n=1 Tax=Prosthecomicrobium sp. N25 TaxID=3129254 RepID=UPI003076B2AD
MTPEPVHLLIAGAAKAVVLQLAEALAAEGHFRLAPAFDTVGALRDRVLAGEPAAATILSDEALAAVRAAGLGRGEILPLGRTGIGLGMRPGLSPAPIDSPEAFRALLGSGLTIGYADPSRGATAGRHFRALLERTGLADPLRDRLRMFPFGVDAVAALARGEVDLAVSQATEIVTVPQVTFLGTFPEPYALTTGYGALALDESPGAAVFMACLAAPETAPILARSGFF